MAEHLRTIQTGKLYPAFSIPQLYHHLDDTVETYIAASRLTDLGPKLPTLSYLASYLQETENINLSNYLLVMGQHCLLTTGSLLDVLIHQFHCKPTNMFIVGKNYSNHEPLINKMRIKGITYQPNHQRLLNGFDAAYSFDIYLLWEQVLASINPYSPPEGIIILDDGGFVLKQAENALNQLNIDIPVACVEQTSSGVTIAKNIPYPTVMLAQSAIKKIIEPKMVAQLLMQQLPFALAEIKELQFNEETPIGIIGFGNVGKALYYRFKKNRYKNLYVFDKDENKTAEIPADVETFDGLLSRATLIIGCSGTNAFEAHFHSLLKQQTDKYFISISSRTTEFQSILDYKQSIVPDDDNADSLSNITIPTKCGAKLTLIRGGTPFNFNNGPHAIPPLDIDLTRALSLVSIHDAYKITKLKRKLQGSFQLNPKLTWMTVSKWLDNPSRIHLTLSECKKYLDVNWIIRNSGGKLIADVKENLID